jgi:hypothetical protein
VNRNRPSSTAATANAPTASRSLQPLAAARMNAYTSAVIPAVEVTAPVRSNRPGWRADSVTNIGVTASTTMPTGTLTNSTQRQDSHSVITPPRTRPSEAPPMATAE